MNIKNLIKVEIDLLEVEGNVYDDLEDLFVCKVINVYYYSYKHWVVHGYIDKKVYND